jgi:hypothetical protein
MYASGVDAVSVDASINPAKHERHHGGNVPRPYVNAGTINGRLGSKVLTGGDLVLSAGDGKTYGNNGSAPVTINGGNVYLCRTCLEYRQHRRQ